MKKLLTFLTLLFCAQTSIAQAYFPDIEWSRCYGSSEGENSIDIQATHDGGYIVLGASASTDGDLINAPFGYKTWILKLDGQGNIEWQTYLQNIGNPGNIAVTSDGGYILGGDVFTKLNGNGTIDWQSSVQSKYVLQTFDGGYALQSNAWGLPDDYPQITKLDNMGSILWSNSYVAFDPWTYYFVDAPITQTTDSLLVMAGGERDSEVPESGWNWLQVINIDGSLKWKKPSYAGFNLAFKETHNHKFVGTTYNNEIRKADTILSWYKPTYFSRATDVEVNIDGSIVACGWKKNPHDSVSNACITKRLANGDSIINIMPGGSRMDQFVKIALTNDTGYIALGISNSIDGDVPMGHGKHDIWVVKYKEDTSVHPLPPPVVVSVNKAPSIEYAKVYPNPSSGTINISLPQGYEDAMISVYNIVGQNVHFEASGSGLKRSVQLTDQPAGQYILEVSKGIERKSFRITLTP